MPPSDLIQTRLGAIADYHQGDSRVAHLAVEALVYAAGTDPDLKRGLAAAMARMLGTGASVDCKSSLCRWLHSIGSEAEAPAVAALLLDPKLSDLARYAVAGLPGPEAARQLRSAAAQASGLIRTGLENELARRRDA